MKMAVECFVQIWDCQFLFFYGRLAIIIVRPITNINMFGVNPVLRFTHLNALAICGILSSQSPGVLDTKHLTASINVLLNRSTCPLVDARKGVVRVLLILSTSHISLSSLLLKLVPWSVNICKGYPNLVKNSLIAARAVTSVVCEGRGIHSTHLVNWSTIININEFLLE